MLTGAECRCSATNCIHKVASVRGTKSISAYVHCVSAADVKIYLIFECVCTDGNSLSIRSKGPRVRTICDAMLLSNLSGRETNYCQSFSTITARLSIVGGR
jgi:hypothetical protein